MSTAIVARAAFNRRIATSFARQSLRPLAVQSMFYFFSTWLSFR